MGGTQLWGKTKNGMQIGYDTPATNGIKKRIQKIVGIFLYYSRAVDPPILVALVSIMWPKQGSMKKTAQYIKQLLDQCATHIYAKILYKKSNMVLHIHSDQS